MLAGGITPKKRTNGTAKRVRKQTESAANVVVMTVVTCGDCGAQFAIGHEVSFQDADLATRQAVWLSDQLVWDHIQENKHRGSICLPACDQMK